MKSIHYRINIAMCILFSTCNPQSSDTRDLAIIESLVDIHPQWISYFSYPGRDVEFTKQDNVRKRIIEIINRTKYELLIHIYGLTDEKIISAIANARNRGVRIRILVDQERNYDGLEEHRIPLEIWSGSGLHHPKIILSDRKTIFTGTGNFTEQGLLKDYDSYLETSVSGDLANDFEQFMNEKWGQPFLRIGSMMFMNSPGRGKHIQKRIIDYIQNAESSIQYMIYTHYDAAITEALISATKRGVVVEGIYNRPINPEGKYLASMKENSRLRIYEEENEDRIDNGSFGLGGLLHHKTMIIDSQILLSGSFNYSRSARDFNREIFYETKDPKLVQDHIHEFHRIQQKSRIYPSSWNQKRNSVLEWGSGIFHSVGILHEKGYLLPISSGVIGSDTQFGNQILKDRDIWNWNFSNASFYDPIPIQSISERENSSYVIQFTSDRENEWIEAIHLSPKGKLVASPLTKLNSKRNMYIWEGNLDNESKKAGIFFLRDDTGRISSITCYVKGDRILPNSIQFIWDESYLQSNPVQSLWLHTDKKTDYSECSRLDV